MSEQFPVNQDVIDLSWEAAEASNRAFSEYVSTNEKVKKLLDVSEMELDGVEVSSEAVSSLSDEATVSLVNHTRLVDMAAPAMSMEDSPFASEVNEAEAEVEEKPLDTKESIADQFANSYRGYSSALSGINAARHDELRIAEAAAEDVRAEFEEWFSDDIFAQVVARQEANPGVRFTLVATPNVLATYEEVKRAAENFGKQQPYETYVYDELYSKYKPSELSATDPDNGKAVKFSLVEDRYAPELEGTVAEQFAKLAELQKTLPNVGVPSILEAIAYWNTLRAQGDKLADDTTFDKTYIRHFDLPEKLIDGVSFLPSSYVVDDGKPYLYYSVVRSVDHGRVSVG